MLDRGCARRLAATALIVSLLATPALADEGDVDDVQPETRLSFVAVGEQVFDVLALRPLGVAASAAGLAFFLASTPFTAPARELTTAWDVFVYAPVEYTFVRPIGDF